MISAAYVLPDSPPADGPDLASNLGWYRFCNFTMARAEKYPECAHLCGFGWSDLVDQLEHDLERLPHDPEADPDLSATAAQVLAAVRARPEGAVEFRATDGEPAEEGGGTAESIFREHGPAPFAGAVFDDASHRWKKADGSEPGSQTGTGSGTASASGGAAAQLSDSDRTELAKGIDADVEAMPEKPPEGLVAKAKDLALTVAAKALSWLHSFNESKLGQLVMEGIDGILDSPTDMKKLGYNPNNSSGTANPRTADAVASNLEDALGFGVSGHLVASIASKVLTKVFFWAKSKLSGGKSESVEADDGVELWADLISQLLGHLAKEFGTGGAPDKETVAKNLRTLLGAK